MAAGLSPQAALSRELYAYLVEALYALPAPERRDAHWVMSAEWLTECHNMTGSDGRPLWEPSPLVEGPELLLGKPIEVREGGGAPHLEN